MSSGGEFEGGGDADFDETDADDTEEGSPDLAD